MTLPTGIHLTNRGPLDNKIVGVTMRVNVLQGAMAPVR